jgi:hypothetical protein
MRNLFGLTFVVFVLFMTQEIIAQMGGIGMPLSDTYRMMQYSKDRKNKDSSDEDKIDQIQAFFIQRVFLEPFFKMQKESLALGGDNKDGMLQAFDTSFANELVMQELAKKLAEQDAFKLKKILLKNYRNAIKAQKRTN